VCIALCRGWRAGGGSGSKHILTFRRPLRPLLCSSAPSYVRGVPCGVLCTPLPSSISPCMTSRDVQEDQEEHQVQCGWLAGGARYGPRDLSECIHGGYPMDDPKPPKQPKMGVLDPLWDPPGASPKPLLRTLITSRGGAGNEHLLEGVLDG